MKFPVLSTAFCGCSLQTGTIVIAWIQIVLQALFVLIFVPVVAMGTAVFSSSLKHGVKQSETYDDEPWKQPGYTTSDDFWMTNTGNKQKNDEASTVLIGVGAALIIFLLVVLIIQFTATILLLVGAHKRRPGFFILWLVLSVLGLFGSLHSLSLLGVIFTIINLYFMWVVYSFYRELKTNPNPMAPPALGDVKLQGDDVPHVPTQFIPNAPPAYSYTQKEF